MDKELLYRFFKNEVSQEEAFAIQEWMESSDETRKAFFTVRLLFDTLILSEKKQKKNKNGQDAEGHVTLHGQPLCC